MTALRYVPTLAVVLALAAVGRAIWMMKVERDQLALEVASQARSIAVLVAERDQAREARAVERAMRARIEARAAELQNIREAILKGDDDEIPDWYLEHLRSLGVVRADPRAD